MPLKAYRLFSATAVEQVLDASINTLNDFARLFIDELPNVIKILFYAAYTKRVRLLKYLIDFSISDVAENLKSKFRNLGWQLI